MSRKIKLVEVALVTALVAGLGGAAIAQDAAANIAARQAFMKGLQAQMGAARGGDAAAKAAVEAGFKAFKGHFPAQPDLTVAKTRAKAEIWSNRAEFNAKVDEAAAAVAAGGAPNCAGCHNAFRGPPVP